eukprot:758663-Hanusia_phi.AAC.2
MLVIVEQGSVLSSLLCCCIYGHLENNRLLRIPSLHRKFFEPDLKSKQAAAKTPHTTGQPREEMRGRREVALMMRVVDDFLYISSELQVLVTLRSCSRPHPPAACSCVSEGHGVRTSRSVASCPAVPVRWTSLADYGVELNLDKSKVNYDVRVSVRGEKEVAIRRLEGPELHWCGLVLDTRTMNVRGGDESCASW